MDFKTKIMRGCAGAAAGITTLGLVPTVAFADTVDVPTGVNAILPQMDEFIPMVLAFIVLWIVLAKFGWPLFNGMLEKRANTIKENLEQAEQNREESERVLAEYKSELAEAKSTASQIVADAKAAGEAAKADITAQAQKEAADMIDKARVAIEAEKKAAISDLQGSIADTSIAVASKLIANDLSDDEHRALIEKYVAEAGSFNAN